MVPRCSTTCRAEKRRVMPSKRGLSWYCWVAATSRSKALCESCSDGDCVFASASMVLMFSALLFIPDMPDKGESMAHRAYRRRVPAKPLTPDAGRFGRGQDKCRGGHLSADIG